MLPGWTYVWLARLFSGEKLVKGSPRDTRVHVAFAASFPIALLVFALFGFRYLNAVGSIGVWFLVMVEVALLAGVWFLIYRFVTLRIAILLAIVGWVTCAIVGDLQLLQ
jgi:hypothetical protein